jgi:hypothetical protein
MITFIQNKLKYLKFLMKNHLQEILSALDDAGVKFVVGGGLKELYF